MLGFRILQNRKKSKRSVTRNSIKYSSYLILEGGPAIMQGQIDIQPNVFNVPKIYKMPKE